MPQTIRVETKGFSELGETLRAYSDEMRKKTIRAATRAGAVVIRDAAKRVRPPNVQTGALLKGITVWRSQRQSRAEGIEVWRVGVKKVTKKYVDNSSNRSRKRVGKSYKVQGPSYYWRFLEFGTVRMAAKPFFRPAFEGNKFKAVDAMRERIRQALLVKPQK